MGSTELKYSEAYSLRLSSPNGIPVVHIDGYDNRGVLYGVGRLLRILNITFDESYTIAPKSLVWLDSNATETNIVSWPKYPVRGHQLGYRPKVRNIYIYIV